jgi:hypothetical protein
LGASLNAIFISCESTAQTRCANSGCGLLELIDVAGELLAEGERRRVLQVGAADLHDRLKSAALGLERFAQRLGRGERIVDRRGGRDVHRGGEDVVRRLAHVDVVVGMHQALLSPLAA